MFIQRQSLSCHGVLTWGPDWEQGFNHLEALLRELATQITQCLNEGDVTTATALASQGQELVVQYFIDYETAHPGTAVSFLRICTKTLFARLGLY